MATRIEAAVSAHALGGLIGRSSLGLSDRAARSCLERAKRRADEVDLLVNAGIYRQKNVAEPAFATLVQEDIHANPGHPPERGRHGTFSFDVVDGGTGVLTAAELADAFVGPGSARLAMVVAADADPDPGSSAGFPFAPAGGALLLEHADSEEGFRAFEFRTFPDGDAAALFDARVEWKPDGGPLHRGRNVLHVHEAPSFGDACIARASEVASEFLARSGVAPRDVDVLVASQYPHGLAREVAIAIGVPLDRIPLVGDAIARSHTAGPIGALEAAIETGAFARAKNVLFVTVGAGISVGVALYVR